MIESLTAEATDAAIESWSAKKKEFYSPGSSLRSLTDSNIYIPAFVDGYVSAVRASQNASQSK